LIFVLDGPSGPMASSKDSRVGSASDHAGSDEGQAEPGARSAMGEGNRSRLRWPVEQPRVTSFFGTRWGRRHEGIDLTAAVGTPVYAAEVGEVVYAGNKLRGYGNMVVVRHAGDLMTVYAHNSVVLVKVGERVMVGQRLALSGQSGHATGPHVHFEVRKGQIPRDPLFFLPTLRGTSPKS
jgi:murein DD-endopeptidase MepM/ murein hydrolase activator NlpD